MCGWKTNGDLRIRETVDVKLDSRKDEDDNPKPWKQLYQQYTLRSSNLTNITNISVKNLTSGEEYTQTEPQSPSGISKLHLGTRSSPDAGT